MAKARYRIRNWSEYNRSLVARGDVMLWFDEDVVSGWYWNGTPSKSGNPLVYADVAIQCALALRALFNLPLRGTQGFLRSVLRLGDFDLGAPDYSTISRRAAKLDVDLARKMPKSGDRVIIVVDSSGLKVYGEGEWKVRTHGKDKRRTSRKIHLAIDRKSHEITAVRLTESNHHDCEEMQNLLDETGPCARVLADGAYDNQKSYDAADSVGARALIPPRSGAALAYTTNRRVISWGMVQRNANIHGVWRLGRKEWKMTSGYHDRSLAETGIGRFKTIFGPGLRSRRIERQITETRTKCRVLNRLTRLGMPVSVRVP